MLPMSEELRRAHAELTTWAGLHRTKDDTDLGVWRALVVVEKAVSFIERSEAAA